MTQDEFNDWFADYSLRFPSTAAWLEEKTDTVAVLGTWFEVLGEHAHGDCLEANRQIQSGNYELGSWQDTPQTICKIARLIAFQRENELLRRETADLSGYRVSCRECRDTGLIPCWHRATIHAARQEFLAATPIKRWHTCGLPCTCKQGDKFARWAVQKGKGIEIEERPRYDPAKWVRLTGDGSADERALREWAAKYKPPNYSDFPEYGT